MTNPATPTRPALSDCRTCGACCVGGYDDATGWADCSVEDVKRMSRHARARLVKQQLGWVFNNAIHYATPTTFTEEFGSMCSFLRGTPGRRVSCGIYETRPDVCRKFKPGSRACKEARRELMEEV